MILAERNSISTVWHSKIRRNRLPALRLYSPLLYGEIDCLSASKRTSIRSVRTF